MSKAKKLSLPYANTKIDPIDTISDIKKLLKSYGIENVIDATVKGESTLHFIYQPTTTAYAHTFQIKPPVIMSKKRTWIVEKGRYEVVDVPMVAQAWRLVYWYIEIKLKAVAYGLFSLEREFLNQMLADDGVTTAGDYVLKRIEQDQGVLKLEHQQEPLENKVINAEYKVVE